jgi:hypothetical protein
VFFPLLCFFPCCVSVAVAHQNAVRVHLCQHCLLLYLFLAVVLLFLFLAVVLLVDAGCL